MPRVPTPALPQIMPEMAGAQGKSGLRKITRSLSLDVLSS
jgi:hypothetical protein